jgi:hypothetical protein
MHTTAAARPVPHAHGGPIKDNTLDQMIVIAEALHQRPVTETEAALFDMSMLGCLQELKQWRLRASLVADLMAPGNVLMFPGAR